MRVYLEECDKGNINFLKLKYNIPDVASHSEIPFVAFHAPDWIGYADELTLMFENNEYLRKGLYLLNKVFERFGLKINM